MESWENGRERLLEAVGKAYDSVGVQLAAVFDEENTIRVPRTEWENLQAESARCTDLEEELQRLHGELEICETTVARVEELERDNKRLQRELEAALQQKKPVLETPARARLFSKDAPTPSEPLPSIQRVDHNGSATISGEKYDLLVRQHNNIYEQWKHHKTKHEELDTLCKRQREKVEQWEEYMGKVQKQTEKKDAKIRLLKKEVERLKGGLENDMDRPENSLPRQNPSASNPASSASRDKPWLVAASALDTDIHKKPSSNNDVASKRPRHISEMELMSNARIGKSSNLPRELDGEPNIFKSADPNLITIQDSEDEGEEEIEPELPLPKLPQPSEFPELSGYHYLRTTFEDAGRGAGEEETQDDQVQVKAQPPSSPDFPVVVSARPVRKRKIPHEARTPATRIKLEIDSSPTRQMNSSDSLDLDDIGEKVDTPKKVRSAKGLLTGKGKPQSRIHSQLREVAEQISQETPIPRTRTGRTNSALQPLSVNKQIGQSHLDPRDPKRRRIATDRAIGFLAEDVDMAENLALIQNLLKKTQEPGDKLDELLSKPSPTKKLLNSPSTSISPAKRSNKSVAKSGLTVHREVSQSEEPERPRSRKSAFASSSSTSGRISEEISRPSPETLEAPQRTGFPKLHSKPALRETPKNPSTPNSMTTKVPNPTSAKLTPSTSTQRKAPTRKRQTLKDLDHDPEQEPLRLRPVESLRLEDFKVNPQYNQGYKHAFNEVVRNKDARASLHACTKPSCCGEKFRFLAQTSRNFDLPRTPSEQASDDAMMREFLGRNAWKLEKMGKEDRDKLWIEAKTRVLANETGRHRNAYERPDTPPGFWRVDFPTTQEEMEEREEARREVRRQVGGRYEEAMREGGAWVFRDE